MFNFFNLQFKLIKLATAILEPITTIILREVELGQ